MANYDLILWDIDGTLVLSSGVGRVSTKVAMEQVFGMSIGIDMHHFGGKTDWYTLVELLKPYGHTQDSIGEKMPEYMDAITHSMQSIIAEYDVYPTPYSLDLLQRLVKRDDLIHGIVTGNVKDTAPVKLAAAGFDTEWFVLGAYGSESVDRNALAELAIERGSAYAGRQLDPKRVLVVGDTVADIECARAVGARVCVVTTGWSNMQDLAEAKPNYLRADLSDFESILDD